jgi:hypothetical protein
MLATELRTKYAILAAVLVFLAASAGGVGGAAEKKKGQAKETGAQSCAEQWKRYRESEACFAKYRRPAKPDKYGKAHSTLRPEAFSKCTEMKEPQC